MARWHSYSVLQVCVIIQHFHDHKKKKKNVEEWIFFIKRICKKLAVFKTDIVYDIILNANLQVLYTAIYDANIMTSTSLHNVFFFGVGPRRKKSICCWAYDNNITMPGFNRDLCYV
jgi:hypothetical protein